MPDKYRVCEDQTTKIFMSEEANYFFNKKTGYMSTWGKTPDEDAVKFPAPTLLDMEVTTICKGVDGKPCPFCYKANTPNGENMSFKTFRDIFDKMPKSITQIAFGADAQATSNPDLFRMMSYARSNGVIPNITVAQITDETAEKLVKVCGAVAVSYYPKANPDACLDSVYKLTSRGMKQVNIHMMISEDTLEDTFSLLDKCGTDKRLEGLNAVVFLSLKKKGRGTDYTVLSQDHFDEVVQYAMSKNIRIGFDSCSSYKSLKFFSKDEDALGRVKSSVISCESVLESCYINVDGKFFPCSFMEGEGDWKEGLDVLTCKDFVADIWNNPKTEEFRKSLLSNITDIEGTPCRMCPFFEV